MGRGPRTLRGPDRRDYNASQPEYDNYFDQQPTQSYSAQTFDYESADYDTFHYD